MGTLHLIHTFTGSETSAPFFSMALPAFTGSFTVEGVRTGSPANSMQIDLIFSEAGGTRCWQQDIAWTATTADTGVLGYTVGVPSGNWHCSDWTTVQLAYNNLQFTTAVVGSVYTFTLTGAGIPNDPACVYGAEPNPSAAIYTYITEALVEGVAAALGMGPLGIVALGVLIGSPIIFPVCTNVPSLPPALVDGDFIDGTGLPNPLALPKWFQHFTYGVWLFYCQCAPAPSGSPAPVNPPVPVLPPRLQPGPQPLPPCSNTDVCTTLTRLEYILTTINLQITNNSYMQQEPAYTWGALYAGLSGNGEIAVSGILGVFVSFSTLPNRVGTEIGDPNAIWDVGYISYGSPDGWYPRQRITANPWLSLPLHMANISRVGYTIPPDCTASLRLLVAVPMALAAAGGT